MNNPNDGRPFAGGDDENPFEDDQLRWEDERKDRELLEQERLERERQELEQGGAAVEEGDFEESADVLGEAEQLPLSEEDERLPWLESDDDFAEDTVDTARIAMVAVLGLLAVLALVGLVWWLSRDEPDQELLADGSTIEAPDGAIRARPANPGGQPVEGTGDVSFEAGEGRAGETQLATGANAAPTPVPSASPSAAASAGAASAAPSIDRAQAGTAGAAAGGVGVQVGAYSSTASAEAGWNQLSRQLSALQGANHRIVQATVDGNTVFRLQAVAGNAAAAAQLCRAIKSGGGDCQVAR